MARIALVCRNQELRGEQVHLRRPKADRLFRRRRQWASNPRRRRRRASRRGCRGRCSAYEAHAGKLRRSVGTRAPAVRLFLLLIEKRTPALQQGRRSRLRDRSRGAAQNPRYIEVVRGRELLGPVVPVFTPRRRFGPLRRHSQRLDRQHRPKADIPFGSARCAFPYN
jgi:hypothetical protein